MKFSLSIPLLSLLMCYGSQALAADLDNGRRVFNGSCAACHSNGGNAIFPEKTLSQQAIEQYLDGGFKQGSIVSLVTNGKNAMPAFGDRLDDDEINDVSAYVIQQAQDGW